MGVIAFTGSFSNSNEDELPIIVESKPVFTTCLDGEGCKTSWYLTMGVVIPGVPRTIRSCTDTNSGFSSIDEGLLQAERSHSKRKRLGNPLYIGRVLLEKGLSGCEAFNINYDKTEVLIDSCNKLRVRNCHK